MATTRLIPMHNIKNQSVAYTVQERIDYAANPDKTLGTELVTAYGCDPATAANEMLLTKRAYADHTGKEIPENDVLLYQIRQSFKPGEITPELALEIAKEFTQEHLPGYETVIGVHVDREHIHAHILFNSVNADTGEKYHSNAQSYYSQIRGISDRLCREHGLSVIMQGESAKAVSYIEWLRQSRGQPTFHSMLEDDLRTAIEDANNLGHFFMLIEHMGYEIHHGNRMGFRLRGQERFMYPSRKNPLFTEDGIRAAILGNLEEIEAGHRPTMIPRPRYQPYKKRPKYTGLMALYVHYLYVLGKIEKRQYPPRITAQMRKDIMRSERYRKQFVFLRENGLSTQEDVAAFQASTEETLASLTKQRTILNVKKKKRRKLYAALTDKAALAQAKVLYAEGLSGMETEFSRYMEAVAVLEKCGIPRDRLMTEKAEIYEQLAEINRQIRAERKKLALCREIQSRLPQMQQDINQIEEHSKEVERDERRRR